MKGPKGHPYLDFYNKIPQARLIMEKIIGRYVNPLVEDVHHINGIVTDNSIDNLVLLTKKEHRRFHSGWKLIEGEWYKTCNNCGIFMKVDGNFYKRKNGHNEYMSQCKYCIKEVSKKWRERNGNTVRLVPSGTRHPAKGRGLTRHLPTTL